MIELKRKDFSLEVEIPRFAFLLESNFLLKITERCSILRKKFVFNYKQALFYELSILKDIDEKWLFNFLNSCGRISMREFAMIPFARRKYILQFIIDTYAKGYFGKKTKTSNPAPFNSLIAFLVQETSETLETLNGYTWEQIQFLIDGVIWNMNERTEKGKRENRMKMNLDEMRREMSYDEALTIAHKI